MKYLLRGWFILDNTAQNDTLVKVLYPQAKWRCIPINDTVRALAETLFAKHETRFRRKEKDAFLDVCMAAFLELGYQESEIVKQKTSGGTNLVVGPPDADYLVTAHYDTPGRNGFLLFATPWVGQVWGNVAAIAVMIPLFFMFTFVTGFAAAKALQAVNYHANADQLASVMTVILMIALFAVCILMFAVKNKHNHNDNTSGVLGVFSVAAQAAGNPELRKNCAFILFDNEEWMLLGSSAFARWRKKNHPGKQNSQVFNLDGIAGGDVLLLAVRKKFDGLHDFNDAMKAEGFDVAVKRSQMVYMSDHAVFKRGVMISLLKRSKAGPLYIPRIHTSKDTFCDLDNLGRLGGAVYRHIAKNIGGNAV